MSYPATTNYLAMKLNWMARHLKSINDPTTIEHWVAAMQSVFKLFEDFSTNKALSTPLPVITKQRDFYRVPAVNITPFIGTTATRNLRKSTRTPKAKGDLSELVHPDTEELGCRVKNTGLTEKLLVSGDQFPEQEDLIKGVPMELDAVEIEHNNPENIDLDKVMVPGTRIWYSGNQTWALHEFKGTDEYEILHREETNTGEDTRFTVKRLKTGITYEKTCFPESKRARFKT